MQFKDVIGQQELKQALIKEVISGSVSHAKLLHGKAGYGGLALSLAYVQFLFCAQRSETDSCGQCPSCLKVSHLQHPDLHFSFPSVQDVSKTSDPLIKEWRTRVLESPYFNLNDWIRQIDPKERNPIISADESQAIIRKLSLKSYEGNYKVVILWMAEELNTSSSNKLLKVLEEPVGDTVFILLSEGMEKLLPTVVSRTQRFRIPRIDAETMRAYLKSKNVKSKDIETIVSRAEGDLIETALLTGEHSDQEMLKEKFMELMRVSYRKDVIKMMDWAEDTAGIQKERQKMFIEYALHMLRQSMLMNYMGEQLTRVSEEEAVFLSNFSKFITGNNIFDFTKTFNEAHYHLERNANPKILFTALTFKAMRCIHHA